METLAAVAPTVIHILGLIAITAVSGIVAEIVTLKAIPPAPDCYLPELDD